MTDCRVFFDSLDRMCGIVVSVLKRFENLGFLLMTINRKEAAWVLKCGREVIGNGEIAW